MLLQFSQRLTQQFMPLHAHIYSRIQGSNSYVGQRLGKLSKNQVPTNAILVSSFVLFIGVLLSAILGDGFWQFVAGSISIYDFNRFGFSF